MSGLKKILVCGTRKRIKTYEALVFSELEKEGTFTLIEGCCPDSADMYAEKFAEQKGFKLMHFPSKIGHRLYRNIQMVTACDEVVAFWDGFSFGTAHTIAQAVLNKKPVRVVLIR